MCVGRLQNNHIISYWQWKYIITLFNYFLNECVVCKMIVLFGEEKGVSSLTCILAAKIIGHRLQSNAFYYVNSKYAYFHLYTYMYGTNCFVQFI